MKPIPEYDQLEVEMAEASKQYLQTGEIPDALLACFDQNGKWLGDTAASEFVEPAAQKKLSKLTIPKSRRTITNDKGESILLTSCMIAELPGAPIPTLPWFEIRGMCVIEIGGNLHCPNLRRLNPNYSGVEMRGLTVHLPELTQVDCLTLVGEHISIPKLAQARYLGFGTARHIEAPCLKSVSHLKLGPAFSARFPMLKEVSGPLVGYAIREFWAPLLETVIPEAHDYNGLVLPEAWTIDTPSLKYVGKRLDSRSAKDFYLSGLTVEGRWLMHPNAELIKARLSGCFVFPASHGRNRTAEVATPGMLKRPPPAAGSPR